MPRTHLIVVTGLPGTGKTTLARAISHRFGLPVLSKDAIKEPLLDVLGAGDSAHSRLLSSASFAVLFAIARELLQGGASLILEGNFRPGEHESMLHTANAPRVIQVLCVAGEAQRLHRLRERQNDPGRHPGHQDARLASGAGTAAPAAAFLDLSCVRVEFDSSGGASCQEVVMRAVQAALEM